ncbi:outer membrane beta-barrel protein [Spirosoma fluminis]
MKIYTSCLFLLVFAGIAVQAQHRFSIAPTYWYTYGNYTYQVQNLLDGADIQGSGYSKGSSLGLTARYQVRSNLSIGVGILHAWQTAHSKDNVTSEVRITSRAVQVPVLINYRFGQNRLAPYLSAGAGFAKNTSIKQSRIGISAIAGLGLNYRINSGISLLLQPTASYLLSSPENDSAVNWNSFRSYQLGVQAQLIWFL